MHPARGDQKRCTTAECDGIMRFGRPAQAVMPAQTGSGTGPAADRENAMMWICRTHPEHVSRDTQR